MVPIMFSRVWAGEVWGCFVSTFAPFDVEVTGNMARPLPNNSFRHRYAMPLLPFLSLA